MANGVSADPHRSAVRLPAGRRHSSRRRCGSASTRSRRPAASTATSSSSHAHARGLPAGSEHEVVDAASPSSSTHGVSIDHRPVDLRQRADRRAAVRRGRTPRDQLLGRRAHAIAVDVPLPGRLARGGAAGARGAHGRARLPARRGACSTSRPSAGATPRLRSRAWPGSGSRSPAPRASRRSPRTPSDCSRGCATANPTCSCTSVSVSRRARSSLARAELEWDVPVLANSALDVRLRASRLARRLRGLGVHRHHRRRQPRARRAARASRRSAAGGPIGCAAYDIGRLLGEAIARAEHLTRAGIADGLRRVKQLPAASGYDGTLMGFGVVRPRRAKGHYLVLREWKRRPQRPGRDRESRG